MIGQNPHEAPPGEQPPTQGSDAVPAPDTGEGADTPPDRPLEYGGREGPDPVRYGDWEKNGRCIDF